MADDPRKKLHAAIQDELKARANWENRAVIYYQMRYDGLARKFKPFPGASDLHWPLIDTNIEKMKPLFFRQIVGMDTVATFVPMKQQTAALTTTAEQWFDFKIRERSNLQDVGLSWIDFMLMAGRSVLKVDWDFDKKRLRFEAVPTLNSIVPTYAKDLETTDWWVHVIPMSKDAYIRDGRYNTSPEVMKQICASDDDSTDDAGRTNEELTKKLREGITHSESAEKIIVWEVYRRVSKKSIIVLTYSPQAPDIDLRDPKELPFDHQMMPAVDTCYEITDGGWYSPRGLCAILAPFELSLCNTWNHKNDAMAFFGKPLFKAEREMPNMGNLRLNPGGVLPYGLVPVNMQQPPVNFDEDINMTRGIAEQRVANPDYGMSSEVNQGDRRTATEIKAISAEAIQSGDLRARMFRMSLAKVYKMAWKLLLQYDGKDLAYRYREDVGEMPAEALHDLYEIEPKGGLNEVNRSTKVNEAIAIKQLLANSPYWDQSVLEKNIINLQEPTLIKSAFQDPNTQKVNETTDEMKGIPALLVGAPLPVKNGDDYVTRIGVLMQFLENARQTGKQLPPEGVQAMVGRLQALVQALVRVDNNTGKQLGSKVHQFLMDAQFIPNPAQAPAQSPAQRKVSLNRDANGQLVGATLQ